MRAIILILLLTANLNAQVFSRIESGFGGASIAGFTWTSNGFLVVDEDLDALGTIQYGLFDSIGNLIQLKSYDYWASDSAFRVNPSPGEILNFGSHYVTAQTEYLKSDSGYVRIVKFDKSLDTIYSKKHIQFQGGLPDIKQIIKDSDSTFLATGYLFRLTNRNKYDLWVARFDTAFNPLWELRIPDSLPSMNGGYFGYDIALDAYGSVLVSGRESYYDLAQRIYIDHSFSARFERESGALKWWHAFNQDVGSMNIAAVDNANGTYSFARLEVLSYWQNTSGTDFTQIRFGIIDTLGHVTLNKPTGPKMPYFWFRKLIRTSDGNNYLAGDYRIRPDKKPIAAYKFSPQGDSIWFRIYAHLNDSSDQHQIWAYQEAADSGFLHLGVLRDFDGDINPQRTQHFYMLRTDKYGCLIPGCESISLPEHIPSALNFSLYPNPAQTQVVLQWDPLQGDLANEPIEIQIRSSSGQLIYTYKILKTYLGSYMIPLKNFQSGLYSVQVFQNSMPIYFVKLIVNP